MYFEIHDFFLIPRINILNLFQGEVLEKKYEPFHLGHKHYNNKSVLNLNLLIRFQRKV